MTGSGTEWPDSRGHGLGLKQPADKDFEVLGLITGDPRQLGPVEFHFFINQQKQRLEETKLYGK